MKNLFKNLMLVAVAAMGFTACEQVNDDVNATNETFKVNIVGEFADDTRSGFVGSEAVDDKTFYKSAWDGEETAVFSLDEAALVDATNTYTDGGNKASFAPEFTTTGSTIYAFSPKGVYDKSDASKCEGGVTGIKADYDDVYVVVPAVQTPRQNSVDPAAHILAGKADFAENVNMTFNHVVAYGKMQIKNFTGAIDKVEITASKPLAGTGCYYYYAGENEGELTNATGNTITLISTNLDADDKVFWFGCAPADLTDTTLKVKIYSGEDTYTRNVAINKTLQFQQGHVASFGVNMAGVEADVKEEVVDPYTLVTNVADLAVGDKVIIVAAGYDVAMSTTQNNNNRGQVAVTKNGDIVTFSSDVQILTLEAGTKTGTFAFNTGSGYLYAASSGSNYLRTQTTNNDNGSWSITIAADGTATIKAQGSYTRNVMQYNQTSSLFACYESASQKALTIYKEVEDGTDEPDQPGEPQPTPLATPEITASVQNNNNIVVTWSEVVDAASYVVTCTGKTDVTVNSGATLSVTFDGLDYDTQYTVTVKALPATDDTMHLESGVATKTVTTDSDPNAAPLIADGEYVIIASDARNEAFHALSSEDNGKRLNAVGVTFDSTAAVFETPNTSIIWTIKSTNGSYTISNGSKYLHWDSGNYANTNGTDKSVVKIKESDKEGRYNIVWGGDDTRLLSKNNSENYFAFYQGTQQDDLFIVPAEQVEVVAQKLTMSALTTSETSNSITVSWNAVANASSYAVKIDNGTELPVTDATSYTFTGLTAETSYNISVVAKGDGVYYLDSDPATATATTLAAEEPEQPGDGGAKTWVRVTSTDMILSGGTFIIGYEATAKSGKLVPMRSDASGAKTTANGYHYSGTGTGTTSNNGTIDMATIDVTKTEKYEFTISASTNVSGAIDIKRPDGNYIGNSNGKNTARLYTAPSKETAYGVSMGSNDVVTLTCAAAASYPTLQYNASSPRFANYNKSQKNLVLYKLQ